MSLLKKMRLDQLAATDSVHLGGHFEGTVSHCGCWMCCIMFEKHAAPLSACLEMWHTSEL